MDYFAKITSLVFSGCFLRPFSQYHQEGVKSITFGRHVSNRSKFIYSESWRQELSIGIYMSRIREEVGWGGPLMWYYFWGGDLQFFLGHFHEIVNISSESWAQDQSIRTLFEQIWLRGVMPRGVCGHVQMSEAHASGAGRELSQANEAAVNPKLPKLCQHEIVSGILKKRKQCGAVQASYGCLVSLWARASIFQFFPRNSAAL